jgi:hypothetical protein
MTSILTPSYDTSWGYTQVQLHPVGNPALDLGGCQRHAPADLPPVKSPGSQRTGGWTGPRSSLDKLEFELRNVQAVACRYTHSPIPAHLYQLQTTVQHFIRTQRAQPVKVFFKIISQRLSLKVYEWTTVKLVAGIDRRYGIDNWKNLLDSWRAIREERISK